MDIDIQNQFDELVKKLQQSGHNVQDPVAKLIVSSLVHQAQKIKDEINTLPDRVVDRLCDIYIPKNKIDAVPALCLVKPTLKKKNDMQPYLLADGCVFTYKLSPKQSIQYMPVYDTLLLPINRTCVLTPSQLRFDGSTTPVMYGRKGQVWLGLEITGEVESLYRMSFLIKGTDGVLPKRVIVGAADTDLSYSPAQDFEDIPMAFPFDAQQSVSVFFDMLSNWKNELSNSEASQLIYITDTLTDRDTFKCKAYPKAFQQCLESSDMEKFDDNTLWILFDFGPNYEVPENIDIIPDVVPVANVALNTVTLSQSTPIAKLSKEKNEFFLKIVETSTASNRQGFNMTSEDIVVRDFDASAYNKDLLYRDIRTLYNHFIDDYYAFVEYYNLKDGELVKSLRDTVNKIGRSVLTETQPRNSYDEGTYVMRSLNLANLSNIIKINYLTTNGALGNSPQEGQSMENKKTAAIERDVQVVGSASGGEDKADADHKYELLRYYTLTQDRLYTKMDIDAFLRLQILKTFGKEETKRIAHTITVEGAAGDKGLQRGLYIDIRFRDNKNFQKALASGLDKKLQRMIREKSCISMPITVNLIPEE